MKPDPSGYPELSGLVDPETIRLEIARIMTEYAGDDEVQHSVQDEIWAAVLKAIAEGRARPASECARAALEVLEIDFERWYA